MAPDNNPDVVGRTLGRLTKGKPGMAVRLGRQTEGIMELVVARL
jgi:hypothetical protein